MLAQNSVQMVLIRNRNVFPLIEYIYQCKTSSSYIAGLWLKALHLLSTATAQGQPFRGVASDLILRSPSISLPYINLFPLGVTPPDPVSISHQRAGNHRYHVLILNRGAVLCFPLLRNRSRSCRVLPDGWT